MNLAVVDLPKQREEVRTRLLADEEIRERISFRAYEIYQHRGGGDGCALEDWLQAEDEIVASLVEQELEPKSESREGKDFKGDSPEPPVKPGKKSQSRAASISETASQPKARTRQAAPTSAKTVKGETNTSQAAKKPSDASARRKEHSKPESGLA
jgi:Protein of unknown function (DUF2934)